MPEVDTPFIIGVIREKEKSFLQDDEYTRIIQAPNGQEAVRSLTDTVYGVSLEQTGSPLEALTHHLDQEREWLRDVLEDKSAYKFLAARAQALEAVSLLLAKEETLPISNSWRSFVLEAREGGTVSGQGALLAAKDKMLNRLERNAHTPLMKAVAELTAQRIETDMVLRTIVAEASSDNVGRLPDFLSEESVRDLKNGKDATQYELEWDVQLVKAIQPYRADPMGVDAVLAYWFAKELEVKTLRILLSAKLGGLKESAVEKLKRPLYLKTI